jgi:hypothetical protein
MDFWSIQHSFSTNPSGTPHWRIFLNGLPISESDPNEPPRELVAILGGLPSPTDDDAVDVGVADRLCDRWSNTECAVVRHRFGQSVQIPKRGRFELAMGLSRGCVPSLISIWAGDSMSPTLGAALHQLYGDEPVPTPIKEPTPVEKQKAAEEAAKQDELQAAERRRIALLNDVARIINRSGKDAEKMVAAIGELLA